MQVTSTRDRTIERRFLDTIHQALPPDGGLYRPARDYALRQPIARLGREPVFLEIARRTTQELLADELDTAVIDRVVERAFRFEPKLTRLDDRTSLLELFHGPTAAFKDFGAAFLASLISEVGSADGRRVPEGPTVVLVATSGDTGGAVAAAFHERPGTEVVILYPSGRVSSRQELQLTALGGNIHALEVAGSFDDCQRLVKEMFADADLERSARLTAANSIGLGRLLPQTFYYLWARAHLDVSAPGQPIVCCVPSGNFGNLTAALYAYQWGMGFPRYLAATNRNRVVPDYLLSGRYRPRSSLTTLSNAMDVGAPSNFERIESLFDRDLTRMRSVLGGDWVDDQTTISTIAACHRETGRTIDPHTAVGLTAARRLQERDPTCHVVVAATAHPGKFPETVSQAIGVEVEVPERIARLERMPHRSTEVPPDAPAIRAFIEALLP